MTPDKDRKAAREEYEVAWYTKEMGRALQRRMLQSRLDDLSAGGHAASHHIDREPAASPTPREDRAG